MSKKTTKDDSRASFASLLASQGKYNFHIISMPSSIFKESCFTISRSEDPQEGFQRKLDQSRCDEIAKYIDNGHGSIPTAIILSAQPEAEFERNVLNKTISFKKHPNAFLVIDGQHRVWGYSKAKTDIRVPVIIYEGLSRVEEAQLFIDINENQKKVPDALILDVKQLLQKETEDELIAREVYDRFIEDKDSALNSFINLGENERGNLSRITFYNAIGQVINGSLKQHDNQVKYDVINNYLKALKYTLSLLSTDLENSIGKPIVFQAAMNIGEFIISCTFSKYKKLDYKSFCEELAPISENLKENDIKQPGKSYKKLSEKLMDATIKKTLPMEIIV